MLKKTLTLLLLCCLLTGQSHAAILAHNDKDAFDALTTSITEIVQVGGTLYAGSTTHLLRNIPGTDDFEMLMPLNIGRRQYTLAQDNTNLLCYTLIPVDSKESSLQIYEIDPTQKKRTPVYNFLNEYYMPEYGLTKLLFTTRYIYMIYNNFDSRAILRRIDRESKAVKDLEIDLPQYYSGALQNLFGAWQNDNVYWLHMAENDKQFCISYWDSADDQVKTLHTFMPYIQDFNVKQLLYSSTEDCFYLDDGRLFTRIAKDGTAIVGCELGRKQSEETLLYNNELLCLHDNTLVRLPVQQRLSEDRLLRVSMLGYEDIISLFNAQNAGWYAVPVYGFPDDYTYQNNIDSRKPYKELLADLDVLQMSVSRLHEYDPYAETLLDLSTSNALQAASKNYFQGIQKVMRQHGKLDFVPLYAEISMLGLSVNTALWDKLGLGSLPNSYESLLDSLETALRKDTNSVLLQNSYVLNILYYNLLQDALQGSEADFAGQKNLLRAMLTRLKALFNKVYENSNYNTPLIAFRNGLFEESKDYQPLYLPAYKGGSPKGYYTLNIAFANRDSTKKEACIAFLETLQRNLPLYNQATLRPVPKEDIRSQPTAPVDYSSVSDYIASLKLQLQDANNTMPDYLKLTLLSHLDALEQAPEENEVFPLISAKSLAAYQAHADEMEALPGMQTWGIEFDDRFPSFDTMLTQSVEETLAQCEALYKK